MMFSILRESRVQRAGTCHKDSSLSRARTSITPYAMSCFNPL